MVGNVTAGVPLGTTRTAATIQAKLPKNSKARARNNPRPVSEMTAAVSQARNAAIKRSFDKLASPHPLRRAVEKHQQGLHDCGRIGRASRQVDVNGHHLGEPMAASIAALSNAA